MLKGIRRYGPKYVFRYPEALRLAGTFHWLAGEHGRAFVLWRRGLSITVKLGLKPELGRLSFALAKALAGPESRRRTLDGLPSSAFAKTAREIFTETCLAVDLNELDEWERSLVSDGE